MTRNDKEFDELLVKSQNLRWALSCTSEKEMKQRAVIRRLVMENRQLRAQLEQTQP